MDKEKVIEKNKTGCTGYLGDCSCSLYRGVIKRLSGTGL